MLYNIVYALWVMFPSGILGVIENLIIVLTLGFWCPNFFVIEWMDFALSNFPEWAGENKEE